MTNGFIRVAAATPDVKVADIESNVDSILTLAQTLLDKGVKIAVFPELCVTGYTCGDLFHSSLLLEKAKEGIDRIATWTLTHDIDLIVGAPLLTGDSVANSAVFIHRGIADTVIKTYLPEYNEFYERRWFVPAPKEQKAVFSTRGINIGIEICEDLWVPAPPSSTLAMQGAEVIFNLSASDDVIGKYAYTRSLISQQSARCICGYVYASAGQGESSTDLVFSPKTFIAENGSILQANDRWNPADNCSIADIDIEALRRDRLHITSFAACARRNGIEAGAIPTDGGKWDNNYLPAGRIIAPRPFVPADDKSIDERCTEIINIQTSGLATRLRAINCRKIVVGISGGLDSTLALLVAARTFDTLGIDRAGIIGVTMPGFGTTDRTYDNALELMRALGVTIREIPIAAAVMQHFSDIGHDKDVHDVTYENSQARERTQILMDIANAENGIVLGTGDLSELALGWATYNGDHISMYGVNAGVPKTLVRYLVNWFATRADSPGLKSTLLDIVDTPISPELIPADSKGNIKQKTEDLVGPYDLHDFFLYYTLRYGFSPRRIYYLARIAFAGQFDCAFILKWLRVFFRRFFAQQFKRSCLPDGPKVGSVCLSPRGDWRMPSDASSALWLKEIDSLQA
ncbi:MAG: NAD(+) synthase [Paramuribaculum sp.]|nr:NAD(+) synthase [Paramuribaculum sp.]